MVSAAKRRPTRFNGRAAKTERATIVRFLISASTEVPTTYVTLNGSDEMMSNDRPGPIGTGRWSTVGSGQRSDGNEYTARIRHNANKQRFPAASPSAPPPAIGSAGVDNKHFKKSAINF